MANRRIYRVEVEETRRVRCIYFVAATSKAEAREKAEAGDYEESVDKTPEFNDCAVARKVASMGASPSVSTEEAIRAVT